MSIATLITSLKSALTEGRSTASQLETKLADLTAQAKALRAAPMSRADTEATLLDALVAQQSRALELFAANIAYARDRLAAPRIASEAHISDVTPVDSRLDSDALALLLGTPETIMARIQPALDAMSFDSKAIPIAARRSKLIELDKEILKTRTELDAIKAELAAITVAAPPVDSTEIPEGTRRQIDGQWATWGRIYHYAPPGWIYDQPS